MRELVAAAARLEQPVENEDEHLERHVHGALLEGRVGDEGVGELSGEGRVQPERRR